jgi:hypothetical protein
MKKFTLLICLNFISFQIAFSQSLLWNDNIGQWTDDYPIDIDKTSDGILVTSTVAFTNTNVKGLYKYDENGNLTWVFDFFDEFTAYSFLGSVVDENDNIYTLLVLDNNSIESLTINGLNFYTGISLLKINSLGEIEWNKKIGGQAEGVSIMYANGNIYVVGQFFGSINVNNQTNLVSNQFWDCFSFVFKTGEDYFIAKFDTLGNLKGATSFGEDYPDHLAGAKIDIIENIYLTGSSDLHPCSVTYTHITKYDSNLQPVWKKELSKISSESSLLYPSGIHASIDDRIYIWGNYFDSISNIDYSTPSANCLIITPFQGMFDSILLVYDSTSGNYINSKVYNTCNSEVLETFGNHQTMTVNRATINDLNANEIIVFTTFFNRMNFSNGTYEPSNRVSSFNEFLYDENLLLFSVNKNDLESNFIQNFSGSLPSDLGVGLRDVAGFALIDNNNYYLTAAFQENPLNIFEGSLTNNSGNNNSDVAVSKLNLQNVLSLNDFEENKEFALYPNPFENSLYFKSNYKFNIHELNIYTTEGRLVKSIIKFEDKINLNFLSSGIYIAEIIFDDKSSFTQKIVKK